MTIETERLIKRELESSDEKFFAQMALDGSLKDIGFDTDCKSWLKEWIALCKN